MRAGDLAAVPTVLKVGSARLFFYANETNEAPHVHVQTPHGKAKFWLRPVRIAGASELSAHELRRLARIVETHENDLWKAWHGFFGI